MNISLTDEILEQLQQANVAYRAGDPILSDSEYDALVADLQAIDPGNPYLQKVEEEPQGVFSERKVRHSTPMLSTEKAYSVHELAAFFSRVAETAVSIGYQGKVLFRATPKLDGLAGRYLGNGVLVSRGNGIEGQDISQAITKGLYFAEPERTGDGEIVVDQAFFVDHLQGQEFNGRILTHPRNFMVGFVGADELGPHHKLAVKAKAARFVPYATLGDIQAEEDIFLERMDSISRTLRENCPYLTDGIVIDVLAPEIRAAMGSTNHHHRWQIAYKTKGDLAVTTVDSITWQVGRTGRVTPVLEIQPVFLSGATIRRVTAHTAMTVREQQLGSGARIEVIRSGEVIPTLSKVLEPASTVVLPDHCSSCGEVLQVDGEYLYCPAGMDCSAQAEGALLHFCQTMEIRGFGEKVIQKLVATGWVTKFQQIFELSLDDLDRMGISTGVAQNLLAEVQDRRQSRIDDWRLLAAFGIRHLGRGDAKKLLSEIPLQNLQEATEERISAIEGFGSVTAPAIARDIQRNLSEILRVASHLRVIDSSSKPSTPNQALKGLFVVFTGTFSSGDRKVLEAQAETLGAKVQSSVNSKTSFVIVGDKPGSKKVSAAQSLGVPMLSESEYLGRIDQ